MASTSSASRGAALVTVAWTMLLRWSSSRRNSAATRGSCSIRPRLSRRSTRVQDRPAERGEHLLRDIEPLIERNRRVGEHTLELVGRGRLGRRVELLAPRLDGAVAQGDLEGGVREAARGTVPASHQPLVLPFGPELISVRNSATRRRSRSVFSVSPTTLLAAWRARSATSVRSSVIARCFSASISAAARSRIRSRSALVAAISASRVSWAIFWALARISLASRRASCRAAARSFSAFSRSRRACSASFSPCSIRVAALFEDLADRPEGEPGDQEQEQQEVERTDDDPEQVDLEARGRLLRPARARRARARRPQSTAGCPRRSFAPVPRGSPRRRTGWQR